MFVYLDCLGNLYGLNEKKHLHCQICGSWDEELGKADNFRECWDLIKDDCNINGSGGWTLQYIYPSMCKLFNLDPGCEIDEEGYAELSDNELLDKIEEKIKSYSSS